MVRAPLLNILAKNSTAGQEEASKCPVLGYRLPTRMLRLCAWGLEVLHLSPVAAAAPTFPASSAAPPPPTVQLLSLPPRFEVSLPVLSSAVSGLRYFCYGQRGSAERKEPKKKKDHVFE